MEFHEFMDINWTSNKIHITYEFSVFDVECLKHLALFLVLCDTPMLIVRDNQNILIHQVKREREKKIPSKWMISLLTDMTYSVSRHWLTLSVKASDLTELSKSRFGLTFCIHFESDVDAIPRRFLVLDIFIDIFFHCIQILIAMKFDKIRQQKQNQKKITKYFYAMSFQCQVNGICKWFQFIDFESVLLCQVVDFAMFLSVSFSLSLFFTEIEIFAFVNGSAVTVHTSALLSTRWAIPINFWIKPCTIIL